MTSPLNSLNDRVRGQDGENNGSALGESLMRLAEREVEILLPGHNRIVEGLSPGYILDTARQWETYLTGQP